MRPETTNAPTSFVVQRPDVRLEGDYTGSGASILLLHGLTATRRYVLHGSQTLARDGHTLISYDARGHGESRPATEPDAYTYDLLADDAIGVCDHLEVGQVVVIGQSMGAATAINIALRYPERVRALAIITPAHLGAPSTNLAHWDALSQGLLTGGVDGFLAAYGTPQVPERMRETVRTVMRQRLERHRYPDGVAAALHAIPRSVAFNGLDALSAIGVPTLIIGSRDEFDPDHPLVVAEDYAMRIHGSHLVVDPPGQSPLAWRGGSLSRVVSAFLATPGQHPELVVPGS